MDKIIGTYSANKETLLPTPVTVTGRTDVGDVLATDTNGLPVLVTIENFNEYYTNVLDAPEKLDLSKSATTSK